MITVKQQVTCDCMLFLCVTSVTHWSTEGWTHGNKPKTLSYRCMFEKCNKCTFLLKNLQSLSYECTGFTDFELTNVRDAPTHPLVEMLMHLKISVTSTDSLNSLNFIQLDIVLFTISFNSACEGNVDPTSRECSFIRFHIINCIRFITFYW